MKKNVMIFLAGIGVAMALSFKTVYEPRKTTAEAVKIKNIIIFTDCEPVNEYEILGEEKLSSWTLKSGTYSDTRNTFIDRAKKNHPEVEALIFNSSDGGFSASAIKFRK